MERKRSDETEHRRPSGAAVQKPELTRALYRALFEEWAAHGYAAISLERVALRARAGKAAIYRRWPTKLEFASEAVEAVGIGMTEVGDQGSLAGDVLAQLRALRTVLRHPLVRRILPDLHAERARNGELAPMLDRVAAARRARAEAMLDRAIERGELPAAIDRRLALDLLPSPLYWRLVVIGGRVSDDELRTQTRALLAAFRAC